MLECTLTTPMGGTATTLVDPASLTLVSASPAQSLGKVPFVMPSPPKGGHRDTPPGVCVRRMRSQPFRLSRGVQQGHLCEYRGAEGPSALPFSTFPDGSSSNWEGEPSQAGSILLHSGLRILKLGASCVPTNLIIPDQSNRGGRPLLVLPGGRRLVA